jgi:DNA repair protein RecO (recombination protein O)
MGRIRAILALFFRVPLTTDQAICIRVWDWSETSQTVSLFGRQTGVIRGVAKGAKRENARFSGGLEVMTRGEFIASIKNTENLAVLTAWDLQETFPAARASLSAFYAGMSMLDLVHHAVKDHDPHPGLYDALIASLRELGEPERDRSALLWFLWTVLVETGHQPEVFHDAAGGDLAAARSYAFSARLGGLTRDSQQGDGVWRVRAETVELMRGLAAGAPEGDSATVERATKLLALYFREVFACELPSMRSLLKDG